MKEKIDRLIDNVYLFFVYRRDDILNHVAVWCIEHCHNYGGIFYAACKQLSVSELKVHANEVIEAKQRGEF